MADEFRNGVYAGVRYLVEDGGEWYRADDVASVLGLGADEVKSCEGIRHFGFDDEDGDYIPSRALARVVDDIIGFNTETMRQLWVSAWYDDLTAYVRDGEPLPTMFGGDCTGDTLIGLVERSSKAARTDAERELADVREDVRGTASSMGLALDSLEDAVTFVDGMRLGLSLTSPNGSGMGAFANLFCDLRGVEDAMQRIHSRLEDLAGGDGDE